MNDDHYEQAWKNESGKIIPFLQYEGELSQTIQINSRLFLTSERSSGHSFSLELIGVKPVGSEDNPKWGTAVSRGFQRYYFGKMRNHFNPIGYRYKFRLTTDFRLSMEKMRINPIRL